MLVIAKIEDLLKHSIDRVTNIIFEGRFYDRIRIYGERGDVFYCEEERQIIKVVDGLAAIEYRILTEISPNEYKAGYFPY